MLIWQLEKGESYKGKEKAKVNILIPCLINEENKLFSQLGASPSFLKVSNSRNLA